MEEISSWRDILRNIISNPLERERIAQQINVHQMTLVRWAQGISVPRSYNLKQLLQALSPDTRKQFGELLGPLNPDPAPLSPHTYIAGIDVRFIMEIYKARETTPEMFHFYGISHLIFQQALRLLDPQRNGLTITMTKCMPPSSDGKIRSLRVHMSQGTVPQKRDMSEPPIFLGAESLEGYVVTKCHAQVMQSLIDTNPNPTALKTDEGSAMGCPILYANRIAGCLSFVSPVSGYFELPARFALAADFAHLISLAFKSDEFYPAEAIELFVMPPAPLQQPWLLSFRQRVIQMMKEASQNSALLMVTQAEELTWQELETQLIEVSRQLFSEEIAK